MNKEEFIASLLAKIASCYQFFQTNEHSVQMWLSGLKGCTAEEVWMALDEHIKTSKFPPTIAEIREIIAIERQVAYQSKFLLIENKSYELQKKS